MKIADYGKAITSYIESPTTAQKLQAKGKAQMFGRAFLAEGTDIVPPRKPRQLKDLFEKINRTVLAVSTNTISPEFIVPKLEKETQQYIKDGIISGADARKFAVERKEYWDNWIKENPGGTAPVFDFDNEGKAIEVSDEEIIERINEADGGRIDLKRGTNLSSLKALEEINVAGSKRTDAKVNRFKELIKLENKTPNEAKMIVMKEFGIERNVKAGTPKWMTRGKKELLEEGFEFTESKRGPEAKGDSKEVATKKRKQVIGKEEGQFEERLKKEKTKTGFGKKFETAHTANIFQAKKLGIEYPIDALAIQATDVNQVIAEGLNDELKPLYKKQLTLVNKLKKNNTFALRKELDDLNRLIADTVATGGKQGNKAANVLKPIIVDPKTLEGKILNLGFDTSSEVMAPPGATTKKTKAGDIDDLMARMNIKEKVIQKASDIDRPEKALLSDKFKTAFTKGAKSVGKVIKPVGYAFGVNAVKNAISKAEDMGIELSITDKIMAFDSGDEDIAINNYRRRNDPEFAAAERAKDLAKMTDDFEEVGKTTFGKYNDQIKNIKLP
jgi:hypothetical protein